MHEETLVRAPLDTKEAQLRASLAAMGGVVVGLSGGVDSVLLAWVAHEVLGARALAVIANSPALPQRELQAAEALARRLAIPHLVLATTEVVDPRYAANPTNRCYFCKSELFARLRTIAAERGLAWVAYGENYDDLDDHRPGVQAAIEYGVRAPLKEATLTKADIRALARRYDLPVWAKPAFACLASRFPYGTPITPANLAQVEAAEAVLAALGLQQYRVRYHGDLARIEVPPTEMEALIACAAEVVQRIRTTAGFQHITLDLAGYRRGSLNEAVELNIPLAPRQS